MSELARSPAQNRSNLVDARIQHGVVSHFTQHTVNEMMQHHFKLSFQMILVLSCLRQAARDRHCFQKVFSNAMYTTYV